jgi:hypothetical protein
MYMLSSLPKLALSSKQKASALRRFSHLLLQRLAVTETRVSPMKHRHIGRLHQQQSLQVY